MVDGARGRSALAQLTVYPGAWHGFDMEDVPLHLTSANPDEPGSGHLGSDPAATLAALEQLELGLPQQIAAERAWLEQQGQPVLQQLLVQESE